MNVPENTFELRALLDHLCNDDLNVDGFERLMELLSDDVEAQKFYIQYTDMNESMRHMAVTLEHQEMLAELQAKLSDLRALSEADLFAEAVHSRAGNCSLEGSTFEEPTIEVSKRGESRPRREGRDAAIGSWLGSSTRLVPFLSGSALAGAIALLLMQAGYFVPGPPDATSFSSSGLPPAAYITSTNGCNWSGTTPSLRAAGNGIQVGDEIALQEGIAEFRTANGAYISVEGPADFVLTSADSLVLQYGKVTTQVPWSMREFRVMAGGCRLTTSEAEFGVCVAGARIDTHVFAGEVLATNAQIISHGAVQEDAPTSPASSGDAFLTCTIGEGRSLTLTTRDGVMKRSRWTRANPAFFATKLNMAGPLPVSKAYVDAVLASAPKAYWRFESQSNGIVKSEVPSGGALSMVGNVRLVDLGGYRAAEFPPGVDGYFYSRDAVEALANTDYSLEVWVKPSHVHYGTILGMCPSEPINVVANSLLLEVQSSSRQPGRDNFGHPSSVRFLHRDPPNRNAKLGTNCYSTLPYTVRRWQHIVAVKHGPQMSLYIDGKQDGEASDASSLAPGQRLVVGRQALSVDNAIQFIGQLDEVAVYSRALSAEEIQEHCNKIEWSQATKPTVDPNKS